MSKTYLALFAALLTCCAMAFAVVREVPGDFATIQSAVDACSEADTVAVAPGTYYENIQIGLPIALFGSGWETTTIDGRGLENAITVYHESGTAPGKISGFAIINPGPDSVAFSGGIRVSGTSSPWEIRDCFVHDTRSIGIFCAHGEVLITRNIVVNCAFAEQGYPFALMISSDGFATVTHNDFRGSLMGVYAHPQFDSAVVINNIIVGHQVGVSLPAAGSTVGYNCTFQNGQDYSGPEPGIGAINVDPQFLGGVPYSFELTAGSPCIDSGDPSFPLDEDGTRCDIGARSFVAQSVTNISHTVPATPRLLENYPNPFNPSTSISFELPASAWVKLKVYDLTGRQVALLADGVYQAGRHTTRFSGEGLTSGVYFYRLVANDIVATRKMMLLK